MSESEFDYDAWQEQEAEFVYLLGAVKWSSSGPEGLVCKENVIRFMEEMRRSYPEWIVGECGDVCRSAGKANELVRHLRSEFEEICKGDGLLPYRCAHGLAFARRYISFEYKRNDSKTEKNIRTKMGDFVGKDLSWMVMPERGGVAIVPSEDFYLKSRDEYLRAGLRTDGLEPH